MSRGEVENVEAATCHALRRSVLRAGDETAIVDWPEDALAGSFHLAIRAGDDIVAVASFAPVATSHRPGARAWQLRGMAVDPALQRSGYGAVLLDAAVGRLRSAGAEVLWAKARDTALEFYLRCGMSVVGDGYLTPDTGLPHHTIVFDLS